MGAHAVQLHQDIITRIAYHAQPGHTLACMKTMIAHLVLLDQRRQEILYIRAHHARPGHMLVQLDRLSAQNVRKDRHHQLVHRRAHPVRWEHTPLQPDLHVDQAWPGHILVQLDRLSAKNVRKDPIHQLVHRRAHPVRRGPTPLKLGRRYAHFVVQGHTRVRLDQ